MKQISFISFGLLAFITCSSAFAKTSNCSVNYVSADYNEKQNSIVYWSYTESELSEKLFLYDTDNHISQIKSSVDEFFRPLIIWVESSKKGDRLYSIKLGLDGNWTEPTLIERTENELTSTSLVRAPDGKSYVSWASDESGNDDVYLAHFSNGNWSEPIMVNEKNAIPDILPRLSVERDGSVGLTWRTFTSPSIGYEDRFNELTLPLSALEKKELESWQCHYDKSDIPQPNTNETLFINYYQDAFDSFETQRY